MYDNFQFYQFKTGSSKARQTAGGNAIKLVNGTGKWGLEPVNGVRVKLILDNTYHG
jgi:hypothetical protein